MTPIQIWNTLGRRSKLALAARDPREIADVLKCRDGEWAHDRAIVESVLARADEYAARVRK